MVGHAATDRQGENSGGGGVRTAPFSEEVTACCGQSGATSHGGQTPAEGSVVVEEYCVGSTRV